MSSTRRVSSRSSTWRDSRKGVTHEPQADGEAGPPGAVADEAVLAAVRPRPGAPAPGRAPSSERKRLLRPRLKRTIDAVDALPPQVRGVEVHGNRRPDLLAQSREGRG